MIKTIYFDNEITTENIAFLINEIETCICPVNSLSGVPNQYTEIRLFFSTNGGDVCAMNGFTNYLNNLQFPITIVAFKSLFSAGFEFITSVSKSIEILDDCVAMAHLSDTWVSSRGLNNTGSSSYFYNELIKSERDKTIARYKGMGMTKKELEIVSGGRDLWITNDRLNELIANQRRLDNEKTLAEEIADREFELKQLKTIKKMGL